MATRLLSALVGVLADRFRTTTDTLRTTVGGTVGPVTLWSPHLGRIPGWSTPLTHMPVISHRFAATPDQVRHARAFVADLLRDDHPLLDDAMLLTSELATNAVEHSDTGSDGRPREFVVTIAFLPAPYGVMITV